MLIFVCLLDDMILGFCKSNFDMGNRWARTHINYHPCITSKIVLVTPSFAFSFYSMLYNDKLHCLRFGSFVIYSCTVIFSSGSMCLGLHLVGFSRGCCTWYLFLVLHLKYVAEMIFSHFELFIIPVASHFFISIIWETLFFKTQCKQCKFTHVLAYTDYEISLTDVLSLCI